MYVSGLKRYRKYLLALGLITLAASLALYWLQREPVYRGRKISEWILDLQSQDPKAAQQAQQVIKALGPAAVPWLAGVLQTHNTPFRRMAVKLSAHLPGRVRSFGGRFFGSQANPMSQYQVTRALEQLGTNAAGAVPVLGEHLQGQNELLSSGAATALLNIGPASVPALISALDSSSYYVQANACRALWQLGTNAAPAAPKLNWVLTNCTGNILPSAAHALALAGPSAVPLLTNNLQNSNATVRYWSVYALNSSSTISSNLLPLALQLAGDSDPDVRKETATFLGNFLGSSTTAEAVLIELLEHDKPVVQLAVLQVAMSRFRLVRNHTSTFINALGSPEARVRKQAAVVFGQAFRYGRDAVPALEKLRGDDDAGVRAAAEEALRAITGSESPSETPK